MSSKIEKLKDLREKLNIEVEGIDNYPKNEKVLMIANHQCLMDIFYIPVATLTTQINAVSSRLTFKQIPERKKLINTYLNAMPIEAGGGRIYANICLDHIVDLFAQGSWALNIFPEGCYLPGKNAVYRGKTGAARILFKTRDKNINVHLLPIAIQHNGPILDTDSYKLEEYFDHPVKVKILEPINYDEAYYKYKHSITRQEVNQSMHEVLDQGLSQIAYSIEQPYFNNYMDVFEKTNVIFADGTYLEKEEAYNLKNLKIYQKDLYDREKQLIKEML